MKIAFVIASGYGMGGTIRTVYNLAGGLAARHEVEIISLVQSRETPFFPLPDGVRLRALTRSGDRPEQGRNTVPGLAERWLERRLRALVPAVELGKNKALTAWSAHELRHYLHTTDADVVVGTRPGINLLLAKWAPERVLGIGQEHVNLVDHKKPLRAAIARRYPRLDGMTVLTEADASAYRDFLGSEPGWLRAVPNPLPDGDYPRSTQDNPIIVAAGRLAPVKQYPKLLEAFSLLARAHPEWRLRIYGSGDRRAQLQDKIVRMGLSNQVTLMGRTRELTGELAKASLLAVSSRVEGFGMTIIEAFSVGVPAVSFDCPHGPREIIEHERNGLLVPDQDVDALGTALLRLARDCQTRLRMGEEAVRRSRDYDVSLITERWEEFLTERLRAKGGGAAARAA